MARESNGKIERNEKSLKEHQVEIEYKLWNGSRADSDRNDRIIMIEMVTKVYDELKVSRHLERKVYSETTKDSKVEREFGSEKTKAS